MKKLLLTLCLTLPILLTAGDTKGHINDLNLGTWIYGNKTTKGRLIGKVVVLVHWKVNGANIHTLPKVAKRFEGEPFHLIASHIGEHNTAGMVKHEDIKRDMLAYVRKHKFNAESKNLTVTRKSSHPEVIDAGPSRVALPHAVIFDHKGNLVFQGSPSEIEKRSRHLIKKVPAFYFGEFDYATESVKKMADEAMKGKKLGSLLKQLEEITGGETEASLEDTEESMDAKDLMSRIRDKFEAAVEEAEELLESEPARAIELYETAIKSLKGSKFARDLQHKLDEFLEDEGHQARLKLDKALDTARRAWDKARKEADKSKIVQDLKKLADEAEDSEVARRVREWIKSVSE